MIVSGKEVLSGNQANITLESGLNKIVVMSKAKDIWSRSYYVLNVIVESDDNADLLTLETSEKLNHAFDPDVLEYQASNHNGKFKVSAKTQVDEAKITMRSANQSVSGQSQLEHEFDLTEDGLYLSASDSDISIQTFIPKEEITEIVSTGSVVISGKYIVEIIKKLPDKDIVIEVMDGFNTIIQTDGSEFNLNGIDPNEFPNLDLEVTKNPIVLNPVTFKMLINQTFFATSLSETRPLLTGINFKLNDHMLEVIATDSYRLARKEIDLKESYENEFNLVIPGKNLVELSRILEDDKENVYLHIFNNKVLFKYKNLVFLSRLISGTYPVSSNIIPSEFKIDIECNYSDLYDMIDRASLLTSDKDKNTIKLELRDNNIIQNLYYNKKTLFFQSFVLEWS